MKGFGIYVKNNLLEPKHIENMDAAVWLYLWLLDKMTSVNENGVGKVLGGKPITYALIFQELGLAERTYTRWTKRLKEAGYIRTLRTPYGLSITVLKAEKIFDNRSAKSGVSKKLSKSDTPKVAHPDVPKMADLSDKNGVSNKDNTVDNTITTNVVEPPARYGSADINEVFDYWSQQCQYDVDTRVQANRRAASNLIKKYGTEKVKRLIEGVSMTHSDQYAPRIADFCALQQKLPDLLVWGRKKHGAPAVEEIS